MKNLKYAIILFLSIIGLQAKAQNYALYPLVMEVAMSPGETKDFPIVVRNQTKETLLGYQMKLDELIYSEQKDRVDYGNTTDKNPQSLVTYSKLSLTKFNVDPKKPTEIRLTITIPKDMKGNGFLRYTVVQAPVSKGKNGLQFLQNLTGSVLVRIKGTEDKKFDLVNLKYEKNIVSFDLKNTGNTYLKIKGNAFVLKNEKKTTKITMNTKKNESDFYVFPGYKKTIVFNINPKLVGTGKDKTKILLNFYDEKTAYSISRIVEISK